MAVDAANISYVIHIAATRERLWDALTSPDALKKNWGIIESQWTEGSSVTEVSGSGKLLWQGKVLASEPPRLLSFSFDVTGSGETPTRVTFELDRPVSESAPDEPVVRLTVTQAGFEDCARIARGRD